jgi:hypothetical protein
MAALHKWNRNAIVEAIQGVGLDPLVFDLGDDDGIVRIKHKWSPSCFTVRDNGAYYNARYVVGDGAEWPVGAYTWGTILPRISTWLKEVKLDIDTPDLWAELQRDARLLIGATSDDVTENTPFTADEQNAIAAQLQELAEHAQRTYSLSAAQMRAVAARLDYLANAARRFGRKDWLIVCAGVMLSYTVTATLPPEAAPAMLLRLLRAIVHFYGLSDIPMLPC